MAFKSTMVPEEAPATPEVDDWIDPTKQQAGGADDWIDPTKAGFEAPKENVAWSDIPGKALRSAPGSAKQFIKNVAEPISDVAEVGARGIDWVAQKLGAEPRKGGEKPLEALPAMRDLGYGLLEKAGLKTDVGNAAKADAVGHFFAERYGGVENLKRTMAEDPVGFASDLSTVLTAGGTAGLGAAKTMGTSGQIARGIAAAGNAIDPIAGTIATAGGLAKGVGAVGNLGMGVTTQAGPRVFREATETGLAGGETGKLFRANMRATESPEASVAAAESSIQALEKRNTMAYEKGMAEIRDINKPLNFKRIYDSLEEIKSPRTFTPKGGGKSIVLDESTQAVREQIGKIIEEWPIEAKYHTPEALDALKRKIWNDVTVAADDKAGHLIKGKAYNAVKQTIVDEAPEYAKVMKGFDEAEQQIQNIRKELSLPAKERKRNISTAFGKLTSALRNNVSTQYGRRAEVVDFLVKSGASDLLPRLAGQDLQSWAPRGWGKAIGTTAATTGAALMAGGLSPAGWATAGVLPAMSPRLMGELAHGAGRLRRVGRQVGQDLRVAGRPAFQTGRLEDIVNPAGFKRGGRVTRGFVYNTGGTVHLGVRGSLRRLFKS